MENTVLFFNTFLSYLLLMAIIVVLVFVAVMIGIKLRKNKDSKLQAESMSSNDHTEPQQ